MNQDSRNIVERIGEEFLRRRNDGEKPSIEEYEAQHPDLADDIRQFIEALEVVDRFMPDSHSKLATVGSVATSESDFPTIEDYQIVRKIGHGGMGVVYEARHVALDRRVALKLLPGGWSNNKVAVKRFLREAKSAAALHHTNIVPVFDVGSRDDLHYYAMQLIHGSPLNDVIDEVQVIRDQKVNSAKDTRSIAYGITSSFFSESSQASQSDAQLALEFHVDAPADKAKENDNPQTTKNIRGSHVETDKVSGVHGTGYYQGCAKIGLQIAEALAHAHENGIVHRDIKPSNLILDLKGNVWVTDFGLAKGEDDQLTRTGDVVGTLRYMSPERLQGKNDSRSDIYALGMTLYELIALQPALEATDQISLLKKIPSTEPEKLKSIDPLIPRDLETIVHKSIEKDPARRYPTAAALANDLDRFINGRPITARRVSTWERLGLWAKKNRAIAALLMVLFFGLLASTIGATIAAFTYRDMAEKQFQLTEAANSSATRANKVRDLFIDSFGNADADDGGKAITVYDSLSASLPGIRESVDDDPATAAALIGAIAHVFESLGLYQESLDLNYEAVGIANAAAGPRNYDTISYEIHVAINLNELGRDTESFELLTDLSNRATELDQQLKINSLIGESLVQQQKYDEAILLLLPTLADAELAGDDFPSLGPDGDTTFNIMANLIEAYRFVGDLDAAIDVADTVYQRCLERDGTGAFWTNYHRNGLMSVLHEDGQFDRVIPIMEEISAEYRDTLGEDHPHAIISAVNLAVVSGSAGYLQRAIEICEANAPLARDRGEQSREYRYLSRVLAQFQVRAGNYDDKYTLAWLNSIETTSGFGNPYEQVIIQAILAICALENGSIDDAISHANAAIARQDQEDNPDHESFLLAKSTLGSALSQKESANVEELEQAESLLQDSFRTLWENFDSLRAGEYWYLTRMCQSVIDFHQRQNNADQVEFWTRQADVVAAKIEAANSK